MKEYIKEYAHQKYCDYCGHTSKKNNSLELCLIIEKIKQSLGLRYVDPNDLLLSDDDFGWNHTLDSDDMFNDDVSNLGIMNEELKQDIIYHFRDRQWFDNNYYYSSTSEQLTSSWEYYSKIVKEKWRYTFFLSGNDFFKPSSRSPLDLLKEIMKIVKELNITVEIPKETEFYRARFHGNEIINAKNIGTPESKYIKRPNRFSPIGIPMFYASLDKETCKGEIKPFHKNEDFMTIAKFINTSKVRLLDLSQEIIVPGFYGKNNMKIETIIFLNNFSQIISKQISDNDKYLEYIPTQIFTEFLKHNVNNEFNIHGIIFNSSINNGKNVVLFFENDDCEEYKKDYKEFKLYLKEKELITL